MVKANLLIAGDDLKFIQPLVPYLKPDFNIRFDRWAGPEQHNEQESFSLLKWAEVVHCEWLLGNTVWYSWNKLPGQVLTTRIHFFELKREYGNLLNIENIDKFIAVSRPILERTVEEFRIPRAKICVIPNGIEDKSSLSSCFGTERFYNLAIIGAIPARKGLHRALRILSRLRAIDSRFNLKIYGMAANQVDWVWNDPNQRKYFERCSELIEHYKLTDSVHWVGWTKMSDEYKNIGFVLSLSDEESFHVAPVEGALNGVLPLILSWPGAYWVHPHENIFDSTDRIVEAILCYLDPKKYLGALTNTQEFYRRYSAETVSRQFVEAWKMN
ncbi:hypothetical protein BSR29_00500 [Boudabousia liubingyangii]|uniref:Glycosyltransferase n=1 Tax=Boudabousia liubingyangii TaxID=1921764 RepID=A0A1Q5PPL3_9ACTO|nr:glycosyltransferase [Boudabousia liubingyangii]OKL49477.1 hypothetical protein BSR29_00500 [Boudabousia liubingyangii]